MQELLDVEQVRQVVKVVLWNETGVDGSWLPLFKAARRAVTRKHNFTEPVNFPIPAVLGSTHYHHRATAIPRVSSHFAELWKTMS